jgi:hypothetical protein
MWREGRCGRLRLSAEWCQFSGGGKGSSRRSGFVLRSPERSPPRSGLRPWLRRRPPRKMRFRPPVTGTITAAVGAPAVASPATSAENAVSPSGHRNGHRRGRGSGRGFAGDLRATLRLRLPTTGDGAQPQRCLEFPASEPPEPHPEIGPSPLSGLSSPDPTGNVIHARGSLRERCTVFLEQEREMRRAPPVRAPFSFAGRSAPRRCRRPAPARRPSRRTRSRCSRARRAPARAAPRVR